MVSIPKDGCSYEPCHDVINKPTSCTPLVLQAFPIFGYIYMFTVASICNNHNHFHF